MHSRRSQLSKSVAGRTTELAGTSFTVRPQRVALHIQQENEDASLDYLEYMIGHSWKLYRVSPLHNFTYQLKRFKQYSLWLRNILTSTMNQDFEFRTHVEWLQGFKKSNHDTDAVEITVERSQNGDTFQTIYHGVLLSWGANERQGNENNIVLPLLLCRGNAVETRIVHGALFRLFDCIITQLCISQSDFLWINAIVASVVSSGQIGSKQAVQFTYKSPETSGRNQFTFVTSLDILMDLWTSVHEGEVADVVTFNDVNCLYNEFRNSVKNYMGVDLNSFLTYELRYPELKLRTDGSLKSKSVVLLNKVLEFLCVELSLIDGADVSLGRLCVYD